MAYTFQTTPYGTIQVYNNGTLITTTTPQNAQLTYGYNNGTTGTSYVQTQNGVTQPGNNTSVSVGVTNPAPQTPSYNTSATGYIAANSVPSPGNPGSYGSEQLNGQPFYFDYNGNPVSKQTYDDYMVRYKLSSSGGGYTPGSEPVQTTTPTQTSTQNTQTQNTQTPTSTSQTNTSGTGLSYDPNYGVTTDQWNQMNDVQRATIAAAYTAKQSAYNTNGQQLTFADALTQAAQDPNIIAQYADAAKLDKQTFAQNLQQLQQSTNTTATTQQMQFENDRKALAEQQAQKGAAYSGFRNKAQEQLGTTEGGIVQSSRADLQQKLNSATQAFESKYGTAATNPATATFIDPYQSSNISLSGQYKPTPQTATNLSGQVAGGITGSEPIAQQNSVNAKAQSLYDIANTTPSLS